MPRNRRANFHAEDAIAHRNLEGIEVKVLFELTRKGEVTDSYNVVKIYSGEFTIRTGDRILCSPLPFESDSTQFHNGDRLYNILNSTGIYSHNSFSIKETNTKMGCIWCHGLGRAWVGFGPGP